MVTGMERVAIITSLIYCFCWHSASAFLTVNPRNTESKVNDSTYFDCSTDITSKEIHWSHGSSYVYAGGSFYVPYLGFKIEGNKTTGVYNLIIPSVESQFAGEYSCQDDGGHGMTSSAQLIVLDNEPTCHSNYIQDGSSCGIYPDEVQLSCSVTYHGNIPPQLEWHEAGGSTSKTNSTVVKSCNSATCSITLKTNLSMNNQWYECQTTHAVASQYKCNSEIISLQYAFGSSATIKTTIDQEITCSPNSSQLCSYKWKWFSGSDSLTVSADQTFKPTRVGSHRCEATCDIGNISCTVDAGFAEVSLVEVPSSEATKEENTNLLLMVLVPILIVVIIAIISIAVVCLRRRRAKKRPSASKAAEEADQSTTPLVTSKTDPEKQGDRGLTEVVETKKVDLSTPAMTSKPGQEEQALVASTAVPKEVFETKKPDHSTTQSTALKAEQEKQNDAQPNGRPEDTVQIKKVDQTSPPLIALQPEQQKQSNAGPNVEPKGPSLLHGRTETVSTIRVSKEQFIRGVTVLKDRLFIATEKEPEIACYDVKTFEPLSRLQIEELKDLSDMTCCPKNDYVFVVGCTFKAMTHMILRFDAQENVRNEQIQPNTGKICWSTAGDSGNLGVSGESTVILCVSYKNMLIEYTGDGQKIREIKLLDDIVHPCHAIKLASGLYVVSHGLKNDTVHRVCTVNEKGKIMRSFGGDKRTSLQQLNVPNYLVVDEDEDAVLVIDSSNKQVLLLDSNLSFKNEFVTKYAVLVDPSKMCLGKATRNLFVVHAVNEVLILTIK